jgi:LacI family sucrose operon transcriptional repressor
VEDNFYTKFILVNLFSCVLFCIQLSFFFSVKSTNSIPVFCLFYSLPHAIHSYFSFLRSFTLHPASFCIILIKKCAGKFSPAGSRTGVRPMNITAFAQYAGVSKAAVSRYFNGGYLSAEKRAQIAAAVEATGYRPSMQAQMLRTRRTRQIGVIMPRLSSESCARMVEGISRVLDDQNYQLLLINTANNNTREVRALDTLRHDTVDGIILIATMFTPEHHAVLQSLHVPVVIVGQQYPGFSCVFHDDFGAAQAATAHMLQKGRRKPGYLGVTLLDKAVGLARREGFDSALRDAGLVPQPQRMSIAKFNMESGYHQAEQLFGRAPGLDCLFCATDSIALGALQYCRSHSLRVPEDIMIAAVGDNRIGRVAYVPLTSAHLHYRTAGDKAARLLLDMLADPHAEPQMIKLDYELKCRASTGDDNSDENVWSL